MKCPAVARPVTCESGAELGKQQVSTLESVILVL
jgi:hypothetical protein